MLFRYRRVFYTPEDDVKTALDRLPTLAQRSIDCECFGFTDLDLVANLIAAAQRGVVVRVMVDRSQAAGPSAQIALKQLVDARLPNIMVKIVQSIHGKIDHLKMVILDGVDGAMADSSSVWNGSYNFSAGAQDQDNTATWDNDPGLVAQAITKFNLDWATNQQRTEWQMHPTTPASS